MADGKKLHDGNNVCDKSAGKMSAMYSIIEIFNYRECVSTILNLLSQFGTELKLSEAVLKINVSVNPVDVPSSQPAQVYNCLQRHISQLQAVSERLKPQVAAGVWSPSRRETLADADASVEQMVSASDRTPPRGSRETSEMAAKSQADDLTVQIKASKTEVDRRISAFMERKQLEINENNVREFCNVIDCNQENSCARTEAVFTPYPGFRSHVKVTRVVNTYGPQTRGGGGGQVQVQNQGQGESGEPQRGQVVRSCGNPAIEERLRNIETHLKLPTEGPVPQSVYQRLKKLEDRILELEGLSPEYFQSTSYLHKRPKMGASQACSLSELDGKISAVKAALLKRVTEFGPGYGPQCSL